MNIREMHFDNATRPMGAIVEDKAKLSNDFIDLGTIDYHLVFLTFRDNPIIIRKLSFDEI